MIPLWLVDWILDGTALVVSVALAAYLCSFSRRDVATLVLCSLIYVTHEAWESGLIGGTTHQAVEQLLTL
jgi:hypothetical protein